MSALFRGILSSVLFLKTLAVTVKTIREDVNAFHNYNQLAKLLEVKQRTEMGGTFKLTKTNCCINYRLVLVLNQHKVFVSRIMGWIQFLTVSK